MVIIYILLSVVLLLFLIILIPHRIHIKIDYTYKDNKLKVKGNNYFVIKLFSFLPVCKIKFLEKILNSVGKKDISEIAKELYFKIEEKKRQQEKNKKNMEIASNMLEGITVKEIMLVIEFNLENYVVNSYINASLNTLFCMYININREKFNFNKLYYQVFVGDKPLKVYINTEIKAHFVKIIYKTIKNKV